MEQAERQEALRLASEGKICGARTASGMPCRRKPLENGRCKYHGGMTLKGVESPNFKHGRLSKYLPVKLAKKWEDLSEDMDRLSLKNEIGILDVRLAELVERSGELKGKQDWKYLRTLFNKYLQAQKSGETDTELSALRDMEAMIEAEMEDYNLWGEIENLTDKRRKLVESERKKMLESEQYVPIEQVMVLIGALTDIVTQEVREEEAIRKISRRFNTIVNKGSRTRRATRTEDAEYETEE